MYTTVHMYTQRPWGSAVVVGELTGLHSLPPSEKAVEIAKTAPPPSNAFSLLEPMGMARVAFIAPYHLPPLGKGKRESTWPGHRLHVCTAFPSWLK